MEDLLKLFVKQELEEYKVLVVSLGDSFYTTVKSILELDYTRSIYYDNDFCRVPDFAAYYREMVYFTDTGFETVSCVFSGLGGEVATAQFLTVCFQNWKNEGQAILCTP